jgi:hypothetical protein
MSSFVLFSAAIGIVNKNDKSELVHTSQALVCAMLKVVAFGLA